MPTSNRTRVILMQVGSNPSVRITRAEFRALAAINHFSPESKATLAKMEMRNDDLTVGDTAYYFGFASPDVRDGKTGRFSRKPVKVITINHTVAVPVVTVPQVVSPLVALPVMTWQTFAVAFLLAVLIPCVLISLMLYPMVSMQYVAVSGFAVMGLVIPARYREVEQ